MKKIKVFARKLSLFLMAAALAFVALPSNFVFAEDCKDVGSGIIDPDEEVCHPIIPDVNDTCFLLSSLTDDNSSETFTFNLRAQWEKESSEIYYGEGIGLEPVEDGLYVFSLYSGKPVKICVRQLDAEYSFNKVSWNISETPKDGWELLSINGNENTKIVEGSGEERSFFSTPEEYVFLNRRAVGGEALSGEGSAEKQSENFTKEESELSVPNTGENTGGFSATRTGIVAFAVVVTVGRVAHLIRKYQKDGRK